jgi:hypothetical protein
MAFLLAYAVVPHAVVPHRNVQKDSSQPLGRLLGILATDSFVEARAFLGFPQLYGP